MANFYRSKRKMVYFGMSWRIEGHVIVFKMTHLKWAISEIGHFGVHVVYNTSSTNQTDENSMIRNLCVTIFEVERFDFFTDFWLSDGWKLIVFISMHHLRWRTIKSMKKSWFFGQHCVILKYKLLGTKVKLACQGFPGSKLRPYSTPCLYLTVRS